MNYYYLTIIRRRRGDYLGILYLKFKLSNEKTAFVPRDNVIFLRYFTQIHDFAMQREILYPTADPPWDIIVSHAHA
jgi:hypothetical protein